MEIFYTVPYIESVYHYGIVVLAHRPYISVALDETLSQVRVDKHHVMSHGFDPFPVDFSVLCSLEPQLQSTGFSLFRSHGDRHQYQRLYLTRIVQAILKRDASSQDEAKQHQVLSFAFGP